MSRSRQLNKAGIAAAALAIADAEGFAAVSMRRVAQLTLLALVGDFVFGYALRETTGDPMVDMDAARKRLATGAFPELTKAFGKERRLCVPNRFDLGLQAIFDKFSERGLMGAVRLRRHRGHSAK